MQQPIHEKTQQHVVLEQWLQTWCDTACDLSQQMNTQKGTDGGVIFWPARHNTWLLIIFMPKGAVFSFPLWL